MNKAQEMSALADKAYRDESLYAQTLEDIEIAAREGCRSLEITGPTDAKARSALINALAIEGFTFSEYDQYTAKMMIYW